MSDWVALSVASLIVGAVYASMLVLAPIVARWYWRRVDERIAQQIRVEMSREGFIRNETVAGEPSRAGEGR